MNLEAFQINGKNALVTGSHRGLGEGRRERWLPRAGPESWYCLRRGSRGGPQNILFSRGFGGFEVVLGAYRENDLRIWLHRHPCEQRGNDSEGSCRGIPRGIL